MIHLPPSLPDRLLALMRAQAELKDELGTIISTGEDRFHIQMLADTQMEAAADSLRHALSVIVRLRVVAKEMKDKK